MAIGERLEGLLSGRDAPLGASAVLDGLAGRFTRQTVLVTGAGGSIGREVCLALSRLGCARLIILDQSDHGLIETHDALLEQGAETPIVDVLCDVRDAHRLGVVFKRERPDLVIHAAAQKHVRMGDRHPGECVLTNLVGVRNVIDSLEAVGGGRFLLVSTDKAASPVSVMGACKRLAELYVRGVHLTSSRVEAMAVRFGNVFGTRGSVVPIFARQIARGGPVLVTHPDMERYFMLVGDAVRLLLEAASAPSEALREAPGPVFLLEMGEPVKIMELAQRMVALAVEKTGSAPAAIRVIGPREGEKLSEELFDEYEVPKASALPGLWQVAPSGGCGTISAAMVAELEEAARGANDQLIRAQVFGMLDAALGRASAAVG